MPLTALLSLSAAETAVNLMIGIVGLAGTGRLTLESTRNAIALIKDAGSLDEAIRSIDMTDTAARLSRQTKRVADAWAQSPEHRGLAAAAIADFREALPYCIPDADAFVGKSLDADAIQASMLKRLRAADCPLRPSFAAGSASTAFFIHVTTPILEELVDSPEFVAKLTPRLWRDLHARLADIKDDTGALRAGQARQDAAIAEILSHVKRPDTVTEAALIGLARRIAEDVADLDTAVRELSRAVDIAERVQAEGRAGSNLGDFVGEVLRRVAELSAVSDNAAAAAEIDAALAREEAESRARQLRLLDAGLEQDILRRDAKSAARRLARKVDLELPEGGSLFRALRSLFIEWYERGGDKGLNLDLQVAIALARLAHGRAADADQRGTTLNDLGAALQTLGEREAGIERLEEAVMTYRLALEEWTRGRVPLDWARTQMNLGNALQTLGAREAGTERLEQAVAAYRLALEEWTRDRAPLGWAMTQMNLGIALRNLGAREHGTKRLQQAVAAYRLALEERTRDRVPLDWATTQMNLGIALATLGVREAGTDRLEEALAAYRLALEVVTRERAPLDWAMVQGNLSELELALFDKTLDPAHLDAAERCLAAARSVAEEAGATQYVAMADELAAEIEQRRGG